MPWANVWRATAVCGFLVVAVLIAFGRTFWHGFSNYDDHNYVYNQPLVVDGLSWAGIVWAFTAGPVGDWCPLSVLSHMLDCQLYGLNPVGHHVTNVLLHAASAVTLFLVLWRMTGELWPSALVAALFALHPLRVESVAWVAERRDVLSGLFFMLTLAAYTEYVRHPDSLGRYLMVVGLLALGLLAKSILVTVPALLLLLDFWPLGRFRGTQPGALAPTSSPATFSWRPILDKLPLLALAIAAAGMTMLTHVKSPNPLTLSERLANAAVSCVAYLGQLFLPIGLSVFYPHPEAGRPAWQIASAVGLLSAITAAAVIGRRSYPYFFVGWFWYVGMLVPVLGLTLVGTHARADRYTYLSQIGLYLALVWGAMRLGASWPARRWVFAAASSLILVALMACTWRQTGFWQDDQTLWRHALACDPKNITAHLNLATVLLNDDQIASAAQYQQALEQGPNERDIYSIVRAQAHNGLAAIAKRRGDIAGAIAHYEQALASEPDFVLTHIDLGSLQANNGDLDAAMLHFQRSVELRPDMAIAQFRLGQILFDRGEPERAIAYFDEAIRLQPNDAAALRQTAWILATSPNRAVRDGARAVELATRMVQLSGGRDPHAFDVLAAALAETKDFASAVEVAEQASTLALLRDDAALADAIEQRLRLYRQGLPYRQPVVSPPAADAPGAPAE